MVAPPGRLLNNGQTTLAKRLLQLLYPQGCTMVQGANTSLRRRGGTHLIEARYIVSAWPSSPGLGNGGRCGCR